jgi:tight adherence protein B
MMRRPSMRALALAAVATLVVAAPATASSPTLTIKNVNLSGWPSKVAVTVQTPDPGATPQVTVTENGQTAAGVRQSEGPQSAVAVVIDTSHSMQGQKLTDAIAAATTFVTGSQSSDTLGVYAFGAKPYLSVALPATSAAAASGLASLATDSTQGTAIYGGVKMAAQALAAQPVSRRAIVLLTDGSSDHDSATFAQAVAAAKSAHAAIYAVSIAGTPVGQSALRGLAKATGGEFLQATDRTALVAAYSKISAALGSTFTFTYHSLVPKGSPIQLEVSVPGLQPTRSTVTAPGTLAANSGSSSPLVSMPTSAVGRAAVALGASFLVLVGALLLLSFRPGVAVGKRIAAYTEPKRKATIELPGVDPTKISMLSQLFAATEKIAGSFNYWKRTTHRLEQADLPLRTAEIVYIQMGSALLLGIIGRFALGFTSLLEFIPLLVGLAIPALFVRFMAKRRLNAFEGQLPETLITLAASLKAGHAFNSALASVVKEGADPTSKELGRVAQEIQLGMTSEAALEAMAQRMNSTNFGFVVMAVNIQRTVGGSLAEILDMVADTVRQRQQFSRKVKALTAQGRMSAYVLLAMPFLMGLAIFALNPAYMSILFTSTAGKVMIAGSLVMMGIGAMIIRKIVSFEG